MIDILSRFGYEPTREQAEAAGLMNEFLRGGAPTRAFLLKGYAGTGKTSLLAALVRTIEDVGMETRHISPGDARPCVSTGGGAKMKCVLLAPTGRAAKVFASYSGHAAYSIHKYIYRQQSGGAARFELDYNNERDTLFIIDEASMISSYQSSVVSSQMSGDDVFGSGNLLEDLITYIYSGENCQAIFLGDTAQLLPVGMTHSPALERETLEGYGLRVTEYTLTEVVRQSEESGILKNATEIRRAIARDGACSVCTGEAEQPFKMPRLSAGYPDVVRVSGEDLIESINSSYGEVGEEETVILTYSNRRAVQYNRGVRAQVLYREERIQSGDLVMVTRNNYFWSKPYKDLAFIANGDIAEVVRVGKRYEFYGATFADLTLRLLDYDTEITAIALVDSLEAETPQAMNTLLNKINSQIAEDYLGETEHAPSVQAKRELWKRLKEDRFYNALQIKFAYAVTTHKAQGGAWQHVYLDFGYMTEEMLDRQYCQWLYTAVTRAKGKLFLVNFPDGMF